MATPFHVPRVNNNDDEVKLAELSVGVGDKVSKGQVVAQVETDKAVAEVEATSDGYVLVIQGTVDDLVKVGEVLMWIGATKDEPAPVQQAAAESATRSEPTAKARAMLEQHGLDASQVPARGDRLTAADVENHLANLKAAPVASARASPASEERTPDVAGEAKMLTREEKGMLATVAWHRDVAVPGYIEIGYDTAPWTAFAEAFQKQHSLLLSPLLPLIAWRLVELCAEMPKLNATVVAGKRHEYIPVNLGFTVQAGDVLYLTVLRDALPKGALGFSNELVELQRRAASHHLSALETQGATVGFSSMARWKVARHIPILSPQTSIMVAHTVNADGKGVLGASYDHRVLTGSDVASALRKLAKPPTAS